MMWRSCDNLAEFLKWRRLMSDHSDVCVFAVEWPHGVHHWPCVLYGFGALSHAHDFAEVTIMPEPWGPSPLWMRRWDWHLPT